MVKYILTPWWDIHELLEVRRSFYPSKECSITVQADDGAGAQGVYVHEQCTQTLARQKQRQAIARVSIWTERGNCPYMVESTALLMSAILLDEDLSGNNEKETGQDAASEYAVRSAYSTAFSRFVTGLLDSQQDRQRKMNMFSIAKEINLPAAFVELRHEATHHHLPPLARLRPAAKRAMDWIWEYYWRDVMPKGGAPKERLDPCRDAVLACLEVEDDDDADATAEALQSLISNWGEKRIHGVLIGIQKTACDSMDARLMLRAVRLTHRVILGGRPIPPAEGSVRDLEQVRADVEQWRQRPYEADETAELRLAESEDDSDGDCWVEYKGPWGPRPIGCV